MNEMQVFKHPAFGEVRVTEVNGEPYFVGNDVANILGYSNTRDAIQRHVDSEDVVKHDTPTQGGMQPMTLINESGVYSLVFGSKLKTAKVFKRWVTSEVLPSIRKTGGYLTATPDDTPDVIMARAVLVANETITRQKSQLEKAHKTIQTLAPKAELMEKVLDTDEKIDVGQSAKILGLPFGRNTLFQKLRERGIFFGNRNEPKQEYINRGYFELKEKFIERNNHDGFLVIKVLVTQRGLDFIARLFEVVQPPKRMAKMQ